MSKMNLWEKIERRERGLGKQRREGRKKEGREGRRRGKREGKEDVSFSRLWTKYLLEMRRKDLIWPTVVEASF